MTRVRSFQKKKKSFFLLCRGKNRAITPVGCKTASFFVPDRKEFMLMRGHRNWTTLPRCEEQQMNESNIANNVNRAKKKKTTQSNPPGESGLANSSRDANSTLSSHQIRQQCFSWAAAVVVVAAAAAAAGGQKEFLGGLMYEIYSTATRGQLQFDSS